MNHVDKNLTDVATPQKLLIHLLISKYAFYIARYPMDYTIIVQEVKECDHEDARMLMGAVRGWASGFPDAEERMKVWSGG